jgi:hypothetical protein
MSLIDTPTTHSPANAERAKRAAALLRFTTARLQVADIMQGAMRIEGLSPLHRAQAEALSKLARLRMHRVHGEAGADDAQALIGDLAALWSIVDPLVDAVGAEAAASFHGIDRGDFQDQLRGALEGNATYAIERAADDMGDDAPSIEPAAEHRTQPGYV